MTDFLEWITSNGQWLLSTFQSIVTLVIGVIIVIQNRGGKDIDGDGKPDIPRRFNRWYVLIGGNKYFLEDLRFYPEGEEDAKEKARP